MSSTYLHNPKCSKSRQGIELLNKKGIKFSIQEYLKDPLSKTQLESLYTLLIKNYSVSQFTRIKEKSFKQQGLKIEDFSNRAKWVKLIRNYPVFLERPILFSKSKAVIGRPPEDLIN